MIAVPDTARTQLRVRIVTRSGEVQVTDQLISVAPAPIILSVTGHIDRTIRVDGINRRLPVGTTGILALDYTRSTGFHRVEIDGQVFWFATEDDKLRLEGITRMLQHLQYLGTGWTGQALFSDGSGYLDPHVVYGWFDENADKALDAIEGVLVAPRTDDLSIRVLSRRGGSSVLAVPTLRFLRSDPQRNVVEQEGGLLTVGGRAYNPARVVARRRQRTVDTVANRRAVHLLGLLRQLLSELMSAQLSAMPMARCRLWRERVGRLSTQPLAVKLRLKPSALALPREGPEFTDRSYIKVFELARSVSGFGWTASANPARRYSYIESADRIYEVYAAHRVASALGLTSTSGAFGSNPLAFRGPVFDLYYNAVPPLDVLASWRARTPVPDASRPDLLLHERATGRVAVLDAKYRIGSNGHASEDSRKDVAAYQSLYGLSSVAILYPGVGRDARVIADHGQSVVEVPVVGPDDGLEQAMSLVLDRMQSPPYV
ncbi:Uncharacterised protein [Mycobacteroides abscessus subsp. bolletii]|uniref:hypothetical protein n=1 Tax=Mycobacteroides abscessus TaxID=36809 RepID=UPI00092BE597|nr:hypothetical protein [Mycobacteroides abscessus]SIJ41284.1 Uncharacterised protein [Mycobacteroides abscessus subsp. bolletii]SLD51347.1 Uncharacterised protein [Mycobacteroides abscessus subsp. bolletii]